MIKRIISIFIVLTTIILLSSDVFAKKNDMANKVQNLQFINNKIKEYREITLPKDFLLNKFKGRQDNVIKEKSKKIEDTELSFAFNKNEVYIKLKTRFSDTIYEMNVKGRPYFDKYIGKEDQKIMIDCSGDPNINVLRMNVYNGKNPIKFFDFNINTNDKPTYYMLIENLKTGENKLIYGHIDEIIFERLLETAEYNDIEKDSKDGDLYQRINNIWAKSINTIEEFKKSTADYNRDNTVVEYVNQLSNSVLNTEVIQRTEYETTTYDKLEWLRLIEDLDTAGANGVNPDNYNLPSYILKGSEIDTNLDNGGPSYRWYHLNNDNYSLSAYVSYIGGAFNVRFILLDKDRYYGDWIDDQIDFNYQIGLINDVSNGNLNCVYDENTNRLYKNSNKGLYITNLKAGVGKVNGTQDEPYLTNCINQARVLINARNKASDSSIVHNIWNFVKPLVTRFKYGDFVSSVFEELVPTSSGSIYGSYNIISFGPDYIYQNNTYKKIHINQAVDIGSYVLSKPGDKVRIEVDIDTYNTYKATVTSEFGYSAVFWY